MDLQKLTEFLNLFSSLSNSQSQPKTQNNPLDALIGKPVLTRHNLEGVDFGYFTSYNDIGFVLTDSRKLWRWAGKESISLLAVCEKGLDESRTKATPTVKSTFITFNQLSSIKELTNDFVVNQIKLLKDEVQS
jgi:hypothetical protein